MQNIPMENPNCSHAEKKIVLKYEGILYVDGQLRKKWTYKLGVITI